jgi:hypothetical protein
MKLLLLLSLQLLLLLLPLLLQQLYLSKEVPLRCLPVQCMNTSCCWDKAVCSCCQTLSKCQTEHSVHHAKPLHAVACIREGRSHPCDLTAEHAALSSPNPCLLLTLPLNL